GSTINRSILEVIQKEHPTFGPESIMSVMELNYFREKYISSCLIQEMDELSALRSNVLNAIREQTSLTDKIEQEDLSPLSLGQQMADRVASFGGSWTFIASFGVFILIWVVLNAVVFWNRAFDPYPFILLNLILSCIAALQAPVIMMSQNRLEEKDRERAKKDYMINLKSELEIQLLHEKLDHLIMHQQREMVEIQKVQIEMMNDILRKLNSEQSL
ncbi:MAG TPA: DUF1003 domain-containing protein, partial [Saprospiraceae bacterium]|nr:DUF1003 domain-containing protein [Saprospiraceae bacterium]